MADETSLTILEEHYPGAVRISAHTGEGLDRLAQEVSNALSRGFIEPDVETDVSNGRLMAYLAKHGEILSRTFTEETVTVHCRVPRKYLGRVDPAEADVRPRDGAKVDGTKVTDSDAPVSANEAANGKPTTDDPPAMGDVA